MRMSNWTYSPLSKISHFPYLLLIKKAWPAVTCYYTSNRLHALFQLLFVVLCPYFRPLPGLRIILKDLPRISSPGTCILFLMGLPPPKGSLSAALMGCDGSRFSVPLQRSAYDDAEVSLSPSFLFASPIMLLGFRSCGLPQRGDSSTLGS